MLGTIGEAMQAYWQTRVSAACGLPSCRECLCHKFNQPPVTAVQ